MTAYLRNPQEIIKVLRHRARRDRPIAGFNRDFEIVIRLVHACGMPEIVPDIAYSDGMVSAGRKALADGKSIVTDVQMVEAGIMRRRCPPRDPVLCAIGDDGLAEEAKAATRHDRRSRLRNRRTRGPAASSRSVRPQQHCFVSSK